MNYHSSYTFKYKCGYIHGATIDGNEVVRVQVDNYAYVLQVKSVLSAKRIITKYYNKIKAA